MIAEGVTLQMGENAGDGCLFPFLLMHLEMRYRLIPRKEQSTQNACKETYVDHQNNNTYMHVLTCATLHETLLLR
jgi:hypothetical protein